MVMENVRLYFKSFKNLFFCVISNMEFFFFVSKPNCVESSCGTFVSRFILEGKNAMQRRNILDRALD